MIDSWRDVFDEAFGRNEKHRARNFVSMALEARNAISHLSLALADDEALRYLDAMHQLAAAGEGAGGGDRPNSGSSTKSSAASGVAPERQHRSLQQRRPPELDLSTEAQASEGAAALDRSRAAASGRDRQPLQGSGVRGRPVRRRCRPRQRRLCDAERVLRHHLPDRRPEARSDHRPCSASAALAAIR